MKTADAPYRESRAERSAFARIRNAEREYAVRLRSVARRVQDLIRGFITPDEEPAPDVLSAITAALNDYAETIAPWATAVSDRMLADVSRRDEHAWRQLAKKMGRTIWRELQAAPTGQPMREAMARQVDLITSLPREAAQRVHNLAISGLATGARPNEIYNPLNPKPGLAKEILDTGEVTVSRANTIARTETSRAGAELTAARAKYVGSEAYIWRTARDRDVRPLHRKLEGTVHRWDDPPITGENGERSLPGAIYNCRCWAEPILPAKLA